MLWRGDSYWSVIRAYKRGDLVDGHNLMFDLARLDPIQAAKQSGPARWSSRAGGTFSPSEVEAEVGTVIGVHHCLRTSAKAPLKVGVALLYRVLGNAVPRLAERLRPPCPA
jgi:hypothetical protein